MTIYCKLCGHKIRSAKPDEEAQKHVLEQMSRHLGTHPDQAATLGKSIMTGSQLLATYLLIKHYVTIPQDETALLQSFEENERSLKSIFELESEPADAN